MYTLQILRYAVRCLVAPVNERLPSAWAVEKIDWGEISQKVIVRVQCEEHTRKGTRNVKRQAGIQSIIKGGCYTVAALRALAYMR